MTARKKQRVFQHMMEDESYAIIKNQIPNEWVVREFNRPDYGIDLLIELFEKIEDELAETLGEFIYVQVKSVKSVVRKKETIYRVSNVAKGRWIEDRSSKTEIEVVKYQYDTNSIFSIQSLGGSVSILLFLVDLDSQEVYFVCMNDYIDKIIIPKTPKYKNQKSIVITIPVFNTLANSEVADIALRFYGKRAKLLAAFSKFSYQKNEINYFIGYKDYPVWTYRDEHENGNIKTPEELKSLLLYFISQIYELDIWGYTEWAVLPETKKTILNLKNRLEKNEDNWESLHELIIVFWHQLTNLGTMYEDLCREWFLPKFISLLISYPNSPKIIETIKGRKNK